MIRLKNISASLLFFLKIKTNSLPFFNINFFINQSKYYKPKISVEQLLNQNQIQFNNKSQNTFRLKYCPFCTKPHRNDPTNLYTLNVSKQNGLFFCHRCNSKGSYLDLKEALLGINVNHIFDEDIPQNIKFKPQQIISETQYFIYKQNMKKNEFKDVKEYLNSRSLKNEVIEKYNIGCGYELFSDPEDNSVSIKVMYFPMQRLLSSQEKKKKLIQHAESSSNQEVAATELVKLKIRGVGTQNKKYMRQYPAGPARGLFGLNLVKKSDKTVVITEGQLDAMSVYQMTGIPSLSLPQGANSLPDSILGNLDQFQKVILWMDNDEAGKLNIQKFAQKLGISRTYIVTHSQKQFKDANDFLQKKPQMICGLLKKAKTIPDQNIIQFNSIRQKVKARIQNETLYQGVRLSFFQFFNRKVKGIRTGQLSIISGGTGSGKTTLLSQLSIDLSKRKIPILWGSFEVRNQILITNMLTQYGQLNIKKNKNSFDRIADQFAELPIYYMSFHGSNNVNKVLGTITYAIEKYAVNFIVIDTLQFFLSGQGEGYKKFDVQDYVMAELRSIATSYNVHIAVVIHPRKTEEYEDVGIHSIYGTSKATQQADNIWIIQNREGYKIFDIKKNRYDGELGRVALGFNKTTKSFFELRKKQLQNLFTKEKTIHQILLDRESTEEQKKDQQNHLNYYEMSQGDEPQLERKQRKF